MGPSSPVSPTSTAIDRSSRRPSGTPPPSTPCTGSTLPRCTATPSTSSATTMTPRTPPSGRSWLPSGHCRRSRSGRVPKTATVPRRSGSGCSRSPGTRSPSGVGPRRHPQAPAWSCSAQAADPVDVEGDAVRRDEAASAWRAIARMRDDRRRALVLRFVDELSTAEIADVLGRSEGAVRVLIHRALRASPTTSARTAGERRRPRTRRRRGGGDPGRPLPRVAARPSPGRSTTIVDPAWP